MHNQKKASLPHDPDSLRQAGRSMGNTPLLDRSVIDHVSRLARLAPDETERQALQQELGQILDDFRRIADIDTEGIEPVYHPQELVNQLRSDTVLPSTDRDRLLAPAVRQKDGCLLVPRTVE
jgi:aspartyl-tRNA(Asn)/glutamyl-tRNA(Gln) amidotransferase subunit C